MTSRNLGDVWGPIESMTCWVKVGSKRLEPEVWLPLMVCVRWPVEETWISSPSLEESHAGPSGWSIQVYSRPLAMAKPCRRIRIAGYLVSN